MRLLHIMLIMSLLAISTAAYVHGDIYQSNFDRLNKTVIKIEGPFSYQLVTDSSNYSIFLPEGDYTISASNFNENGNLILYAEQEVRVGGEDQKVDLILKPTNNDLILVAGLVLLVVIAAVILQKKSAERPIQIKIEKQELDEDAKKVLQAIDSFEGRATQKELKELLKFSDAKLSLILTELEHMGHVKKFKRGRANIIKRTYGCP